jgi:ERCC4-type nuclease
MLVVDDREHSILELLTCDKKVKRLDVGDFHISFDEWTYLILERKTMDDLSSSIIDGRYKEQKERLCETQVPVVYIIEGEKKSLCGISRDVLETTIIHAIIRDNVNVIRTDDAKHTAALLETIASKDATFYVKKNSNEGVKIKKKTQENYFRMQLCLIPGVSVRISKEIENKYVSMRNLISKFEDSDDPFMLGHLPKIGKVLSRRIHEYVYS